MGQIPERRRMLKNIPEALRGKLARSTSSRSLVKMAVPPFSLSIRT